MRLGLVILMLAALAVATVHVRRQEVALRREYQELAVEQVGLRRELWDQDVRLAWETAPARVRFRARRMPLGLVEKVDLPEPQLLSRQARPQPPVSLRR